MGDTSWKYVSCMDTVRDNLRIIALTEIEKTLFREDDLAKFEKIAKIDGIVTFLADIMESMEAKSDDETT